MVNYGGVWSKIRLLQPIDGSVKMPIHDNLTERDQATLIVFLDDDKFTLKRYMIKAYPQQNLTLNKIVYNYTIIVLEEDQKTSLVILLKMEIYI